MDQGGSVSDLPRSRGDPDLGCVHRESELQPHAIFGARHRGLDAAVCGAHLVHYAVSQNPEPASANPFSQDARTFCILYGSCHFAVYLTFDQVFDIHGIWADIMKRRYI